MHPHKILKSHLVLLQDCQARLIFAIIAVNLGVWLDDSAHGGVDTHLLRRQTCCRKNETVRPELAHSLPLCGRGPNALV